LLTLLIDCYETRYDPVQAALLEALKTLMEAFGLRQRDVIPVFGASTVASDVVTGQARDKQAARPRSGRFLLGIFRLGHSPSTGTF
jgi:hypothetical protein